MVSGGLAEQWFLEVEVPIVRAELKTLTDIATSMRTIAKVSCQVVKHIDRGRLVLTAHFYSVIGRNRPAFQPTNAAPTQNVVGRRLQGCYLSLG